MLLTLGIPNYNRKEAICANVKDMLKNKVHEEMQILIIDDASPDGAYEALLNDFDNSPVRILQNDINLGFTGNIIRLFNECTTDYLVITSNEDPLVSDNIDSLKLFLTKYEPVFLSSQFYLNKQGENILYRGREDVSYIQPKEAHSSGFYISGLVYRIEESLKSIDKLKDFLFQTGAIYTQTVIISELMLSYGRRCFWWDKYLAIKAFQYGSEIKDNNSGKYFHLPARWYQHQFYSDYYQNRVDNAPNEEYRKNAQEMLDHQKKSFIGSVRHAIRAERPDLLQAFDKGAKEFYNNSFGKRLFKLLKRFFSNPIVTTKHIINRLKNKMKP